MTDIDEARRALQERGGALEREIEQMTHDIRVLDARRAHHAARLQEISFAIDLLGPGEDPDFAEVPVVERGATAEPAPSPILSVHDMQQLAQGMQRLPGSTPAPVPEHPRKPRRDVRGDVLAYFEQNPDATFTHADLVKALDLPNLNSAERATEYWLGKGAIDRAGDHWYLRPQDAGDGSMSPVGITTAGNIGQEGECPADEPGTTAATREQPPQPAATAVSLDRVAGTTERRSGKPWTGPGAKIPMRRYGEIERQIDRFHAAQAEALRQKLERAGPDGIIEDEAVVDDVVIADGIEAGWLSRSEGDGGDVILRLATASKATPERLDLPF